MANLSLTNVYLENDQKKALSRKAKSNGTNLSVEVRSAVDAYLAGVTVEELRVLDAATRKTASEISEMNAILDAGQERAVAFFKEIDQIKAAHESAMQSRVAGKGAGTAVRRAATAGARTPETRSTERKAAANKAPGARPTVKEDA
jgi:hypothetical protein